METIEDLPQEIPSWGLAAQIFETIEDLPQEIPNWGLAAHNGTIVAPRCCCVAAVGMHNIVPCTVRDAPESQDAKHLLHSVVLKRSPSSGVRGATGRSLGPHVGMANDKDSLL